MQFAECIAFVLTCKTRGNEYIGKSAKSADEWRTRNSPIMTSDIVVLVVYADVYKDTDDTKDDNRGYFQRGEPVFCSNDM
jgi:hypothetical protein